MPPTAWCSSPRSPSSPAPRSGWRPIRGAATKRTRTAPGGATSVRAEMERRRSLTRADRLPLRVRLTLAFTAVMATVLAAAGVFLYSQFAADLDAQIDAALRAEGADVAALVEQGGARAVVPSGQPLAQVYDRGGGLVASTRRATGLPLLTRAEALRATR